MTAYCLACLDNHNQGYPFHMPQRITPQLHLNIKGSPIENVNEFLGLTLDCNLNFKPHTKIIAAKISRVIGVLHKLKYIFPASLLRMIYNSLILPRLNYSLLAWGIQCGNAPSILNCYKRKQ